MYQIIFPPPKTYMKMTQPFVHWFFNNLDKSSNEVSLQFILLPAGNILIPAVHFVVEN